MKEAFENVGMAMFGYMTGIKSIFWNALFLKRKRFLIVFTNFFLFFQKQYYFFRDLKGYLF